jgi:hypothetical protein
LQNLFSSPPLSKYVKINITTIILLVLWIRNFIPHPNGRIFYSGQDDNEKALTCEKLITRQRRKSIVMSLIYY